MKLSKTAGCNLAAKTINPMSNTLLDQYERTRQAHEEWINSCDDDGSMTRRGLCFRRWLAELSKLEKLRGDAVLTVDELTA